MIQIKHRGNFKNTERFLKNMKDPKFMETFKRYAEKGLDLLASNTPIDTGLSSQSWKYKIEGDTRRGRMILTYYNTDTTISGVPIVILLQYGHGTPGGTYVQGRDFINPAIRPIFDKIVEDLWEEVKTA